MDYFLASFLVMIGAVVQTAFGFGMAVVAAPLLIMIEPRLVPGPMVVAALVQCVLMMLQNRRELDVRGLSSAFVGRIPGSIAGVYLLTLFSTQMLSIAVGGIVLLAVALSLSKWTVRPTPKTMFWASMASGICGSATSIGGPPMALLMQHEQATRIRANLAGYFIYGCCISLIALVAVGRFGAEEFKMSLMLIPGSLLGFYLCRWIPLYRIESQMRPAILGICTLCGLFSITRGILG